MNDVSQKIKYVKLDDGVSFSLVRTNPKLTTNTKLMYNGKKMYMESYASSELLNRLIYKNVSVKQNSTYNKDIADFLVGSGSQAYNVYQKFSDITLSDSYDNQFENFYWCGAEYIDSSFYQEDIGFIAPLYLREKLPNYFLIFRLDTPSNYNLNIDDNGNIIDSSFDFKTDILDKAVLIKTFDLREGSVLGNYIHNYVDQEAFEFDKSMYVNFSNAEVTYYGINKNNGVFEKKVENFENELLKRDNTILSNDKWFTEGFERNNLIFPYIMNIEYLFNDDNFNNGDDESYDFARYIGLYCNNIEFGEFSDLNELSESCETQDNVIYYFEDNKNNLHRYTSKIISDSSESEIEHDLKIDGKDSIYFDKNLISGFEKERITGYAEPLDIYEGFINRAQYGFEILKPLEPGDWVGIKYDGKVECYFADNKTIDAGEKRDMLVGEYYDFRFSVNENSTLNDIAESLVKCVNNNRKSKFEARCSDNFVVFYAKREGKEYNGSEIGGAKMLMESSLIYNKKISSPISNFIEHVCENIIPIEDISDSDMVLPVSDEKSIFGDYYIDYFCGACNVDIDSNIDTYKNVFKIYSEESVFFEVGRYLKTNNGGGRRISSNMIYIDAEGKIDTNYRLVIVDDSEYSSFGYDVSVSSTYQVEILDLFKPNYGILSWFPVKDFDFDINYSSYGQYSAFADECHMLSKKITYKQLYNKFDTFADSDTTSTHEDSIYGIKSLAKSPFFDDYGNYFDTEYEYYLEQIHPNLCLISKTPPYVSKWGYYDEQKDSCENTYRLNVSKVFGVSNLSANTFLRNCDEREYTHNMPYYMTMGLPDYYKDYQYIQSDEVYIKNNDKTKNKQNTMIVDNSDSEKLFESFTDCVNYWVEDVFKRTDVDMFSHFFSGKKYGKRFDRKYSRILDGDKFHNPSTLFRGVKFEVVRQFNGVEKKSSEYNGYKFSFIYIPIMIESMVFNDTVYFVKNDTFKFIVGIVFVNTMLGIYDHNIFNGDINYFNKGFLYSACKDIIRPENTKENDYKLTLEYDYEHSVENAIIEGVKNDVWKDNYKINEEKNIFHMWVDTDYKHIIVTNERNATNFSQTIYVIGEFDIDIDSDGVNIEENIKNIIKPEVKYTLFNKPTDNDSFKVTYNKYYEKYDTTIYKYKEFKYYGNILCESVTSNIEFKNLTLVDVCDIKWNYKYNNFGYEADISNLIFKSDSIQNMLINMGTKDSVISIKIYNIDGIYGDKIDLEFEKDNIEVDIMSGSIKINVDNATTMLETSSGNIENLKMDIVIKDRFNDNMDSLGFKDYFSIFEKLSAYNISESINNDYNIKYYSTVEDNKYKIRVIHPDCIEVNDKYEAIPIKITQNNKNIIGSVEIKEKANVDKIGIKVINRYSGFYNPIFNDILFYDDYSYTKTIGRLKNIVKFEMPYSNTNIDYKYSDRYGDFGIIKNMYYHKTNTYRSNNILTSKNPVFPVINEYALDYRDYNIFSSSWDEGYFISQDDLYNRSICSGIGSMKEELCMFGSKYLNIPDTIFIDTFDNGHIWDEKFLMGIRDNTDIEIMYKEIDNRYVKYHLFLEKRLKRYLKDKLMEVFSKYINKNYSFGNKGTIEDDVDEYVEKNLLKQYKVDKVYLYIKDDKMGINNKMIENDYLNFMNKSNDIKIKCDFPVVSVGDNVTIKDNKFTMGKTNEFDRTITYNLKSGFKESFGIGVMLKRK